MKRATQLLICAILCLFLSCENSDPSNLRIKNLLEGKEISLQIFRYTTLTNAMFGSKDTVPFLTIHLADQVRENLPEGRYYIRTTHDEPPAKLFHFFIRKGETIPVAYDGEFTTRKKLTSEYNRLMNHFPEIRQELAQQFQPNLKNLDSLFDFYTDSLAAMRKASSKIFEQLFLEEELFLQYQIHPIIGSKFEEKIGNIDLVNSAGTIYRIARNPSADTLRLKAFYKSSQYKSYLSDALNKLKQIDIHDPFVEGKSFSLITMLDRDIRSAPFILETIEPGFYPFHGYLEEQIHVAGNKQYAENLLISLADYYKEDQELSTRYNHQLINDHTDSWYVQQGEAARRIRQFRLTPGSKAPDFTLTSLEGHTVKLSDYQGKYLLIDFWGTWCAPCRDQIPALNNLSRQASDLNLEILGVAHDQQEALVNFLQTNHLAYPTLLATDQILNDYGVAVYPTKILVDKSGTIISKGFKLSEVAGMIEKEEGKGVED